MANNKQIQVLKQQVEELKMLKDYHATSSVGDNIMLGAISSGVQLIDRRKEYKERYEMYSDVFTRDMVKVIIARSIGTTHDSITPFTLRLKSTVKLNSNLIDIINKEFEYLTELINDKLLEVTLDSQFFGDGYVKPTIKPNEGVISLKRNISLSPFCVTPIIKDEDLIAYKVSNSGNFYQKTINNNIASNIFNVNSYSYAIPSQVLRLNAASNGIMRLTEEQYMQAEDLNLFATGDNRPHEDGIYGGVMEDCYSDFQNYIWAIKALSNSRISSSITERFITLDMGGLQETERKTLKNSFEKKLRQAKEELKNRVNSKNPSVATSNHLIPKVSSGAGSIDIQESNTGSTALATIEDIMIHVRKFIGAVGYNIEMTSFGGMSIGGGERDGIITNSLQMDVQAEQIRSSVRKYILDIVKLHFLSKHNLDLKTNMVEVLFEGVVNRTKMDAQARTTESLTNFSSLVPVINDLRELKYEDTDENRLAVEGILLDIIPMGSINREEQIKSLIGIVFSKRKEEDDEL